MNFSASTLGDPVTREGNIFRKTNHHSGRKVYITPQNSTMQHLMLCKNYSQRVESRSCVGEREVRNSADMPLGNSGRHGW